MSAHADIWSLSFVRSCLARRVWRRIQADHCFDLAAQTSFYFVLSLFPFCLVMTVMVGRLPSSRIWDSFANWIVIYLPSDSRDLVLLTILPLVLAHLTTWTLSKALAEVGRWAVTVVLLLLSIDLINYLLPDTRRRWRWFSPGTAFVVSTLVVSFGGFNLYFHFFDSYPRVYGAIGGFIILMLWIYLASVILLVGAETDSEIERLTSESGSR